MRKIWQVTMVLAALTAAGCSVQSAGVELNGRAAGSGYGEGTMVKQYYGKIETGGLAPNYNGQFKGYVEIENAAYQKEVTVHWAFVDYSQNVISDWYDLPAYYVKSLDNNKELWAWTGDTFSIPFRGNKQIKYAIKYKVNGVEYWDNNDSQDYGVGVGYPTSLDAADFGKTVAVVSDISLWGTTGEGAMTYFSTTVTAAEYVEGAIVDVIYSTDGWNTVQVGRATENGYNSKVYMYAVPLPAGVQAVDLAVSYTANGVTSWDNNFGDDYHYEVE